MNEFANYTDHDAFEDFQRDLRNDAIEKECASCAEVVLIMPGYDICVPCADGVEIGLDRGAH